jgi:hypothetical protein
LLVPGEADSQRFSSRWLFFRFAAVKPLLIQ